MPLSAYALVTVEEFKAYSPVAGTGQDSYIETVINRATDMIEQHLDRQIVSRGVGSPLTEYHTLKAQGSAFYAEDLWTLEWPIISVTTAHEDTGWPRTYGASYLLVDGTDYQAVKPKGLIRRLGSAGPGYWAPGLRSVRVVYTAGYATTSVVPERIKAVALRLAALMYKETTRGQHGIQSQTDSTGNFTRFGPATITKDMADDLYSERRHQVFTTGERDAA
jgi:hypothetical protein